MAIHQLSRLIVDWVSREGESPYGASKRIFGDPRVIQRLISAEVKVSPKTLVKLLKGFHVGRNKQELQQWLLAYLWWTLDPDGRLFVESSGLLDLSDWTEGTTRNCQTNEPAPDPLAPQASKELSNALPTAVRRTAILHAVCEGVDTTIGIREVASATRFTVQVARAGLAYLTDNGYLSRRAVQGVVRQSIENRGIFPEQHNAKLYSWMPTLKGLKYNQEHSEYMLTLLPQFMP